MNKLRLPIANPCHENWDGMSNQGSGSRFCDSCSKSVHNLSDMSEVAAQALLAKPRGANGLCIRYTAKASGAVQFRTPSTRAPSPMAFVGWRGGVAAGLAAMSLSGCADKERAPVSVEESHCNYEVGPFGYSLARGEGNCPPLEALHHAGVPLMGAAPPKPEVMGKIAAPEPVIEVMGEASAQPEVPCESDKKAQDPDVQGQAPAKPPKATKMMGKIKHPVDDQIEDPADGVDADPIESL